MFDWEKEDKDTYPFSPAEKEILILQRTVYFDIYYIDKYDVINAKFQEFFEATRYITDAERRGEGGVSNPEEFRQFMIMSFKDVNWQQPNAREPQRWGVDKSRYPNSGDNFRLEEWINYPVVQVSWNDANYQ